MLLCCESKTASSTFMNNESTLVKLHGSLEERYIALCEGVEGRQFCKMIAKLNSTICPLDLDHFKQALLLLNSNSRVCQIQCQVQSFLDFS